MHKISFRVYYEDTDAQAIMYYANYLKFAERARTEWLREIGFNNSELDFFFVVRHAAVDYFAAARLDDVVEVQTSIIEHTKTKVIMEQDFFRNDIKIAAVKIVLVAVDATMKPHRISDDILTKMGII
jgi:acyl-CoA thioester hydrolase